jgi:hypothetical protein
VYHRKEIALYLCGPNVGVPIDFVSEEEINLGMRDSHAATPLRAALVRMYR